MTKHYKLVLLKKPNILSEDCITVAYVKNLKTNKPVLIVDVIKDLIKNHNQTCCFVQEMEASSYPGEYYALIWIDAMTYTLEVMNDIDNGEVMMMHELGHYLAGHHKDEKYIKNYSKVRKDFDGVMPQELEADEFAIRECGIKRFINFIDKMIQTRQALTWDKNREKAIKEFELRKQHAINYAETLPQDDDH